MAYPNVAGNAELGQWDIFCENQNQNVMSGDQSLYENCTKNLTVAECPLSQKSY